MVQLVCGPPKPQAFIYNHDQWAKGLSAWCQHTDEGRQFTQCVTNCGEAKGRAASWYKNYRNWWIKQNNVSYSEWRWYGEKTIRRKL